MRSISKVVALVLTFALAGICIPLNGQGVSAGDVKGKEFTQFLYSPETGNYEAVSENEQEPKAFLGVMIQQAEGKDGLVINEFLPESSAKEAGIPVGAVLLTFEGEKLTSIERLLELLEDKEPGDVVKIRYSYDSKSQTVDVTLGERPSEESMKEVEIIEIEEVEGKPRHNQKRMRIYKGHPAEKDKRVIIRKEVPGFHRMENTLDIPQITLTRDSEEGIVSLSFEGVEGKVDVYLMGMNGKLIEVVSHEDLQGAFSHQFILGPGAQGKYEIHIMQGDKKFVERLRF